MLPRTGGRLSLRKFLEIRWRACCIFGVLGLLTAFAQKIVYRWCELETDVIFKGVIIFLSIYLFVYVTCLNVRRLHDIGRRGYWVYLPIYWFYKHFLGVESDGEPGNNRWGPNSEEPTLPQNALSPSPEEQEKVRQLYRRAAWNDDAEAQAELATRYFQGKCVACSHALALRWLIRSLEQKNQTALSIAERLDIR